MERNEIESELAKLHPASFAWAMTCCRGNRSDAEEALQATYLKILDGRAQFAGRSSLKTWLFSVIRMTANEARRKSWLRGTLLERWNTENEVLQETAADEDQGNSKIAQALAQLPKRQKEVLELVFYHDLTVTEAAEVMKISVGSARVHYDRGKKALKESLIAMGIENE